MKNTIMILAIKMTSFNYISDFWFEHFIPETVEWEKMRELSDDWRKITDAFNRDWFKRKSKKGDYKYTYETENYIFGDYSIASTDSLRIQIRFYSSEIEFLMYDSITTGDVKIKTLTEKDIKYKKLKLKVAELEEKLTKIHTTFIS
jgi:hypothetical protein